MRYESFGRFFTLIYEKSLYLALYILRHDVRSRGLRLRRGTSAISGNSFLRRILTAIALLLTAFPAAAAGPRLGLQARAGLNVADFSASAEGLNLSTRLGFHAAVAVPLSFGAIGVQPELMYMRNTLKVNGQKVKMSNVELPVLFTLRLLGPLSVFVGPAFALSDSSYYRIDGERREFGNAKPTLTYMAGAAVRLNHLVLDCRFNGAFNKTENYFEGVYPRIKSYQLLFSVGYAF